MRNKKDNCNEEIASLLKSKNWTINECCDEEEDVSIQKFVINIKDEEIESLNRRLDMTKWSIESLSTSKFTFGVRDSFMKDIVDHWRNNYKWKEREKQMNSFDHFKTKIEGLNIHFIHSKSSDSKATPIILIHGWPGSVVEFYKIIPMLTHASDQKESFNVVCPSIPGYGFSDAPQKEGFNAYECARVFHELMIRLNYDKYIVQGGDWGSVVATGMSLLYPRNVIGCHLNLMLSLSNSGRNIFKNFAASFMPTVFYPKIEANKLFPMKKMFVDLLTETGYLHLQATKPDTVGFALTDSPVGLAAYILEKFSTWTNMNGRNFDDGLMYEYFTKDELLDNVMLYWLNGNITSSMRFYKEFFGRLNILQKLDKVKVTVPAGYAWFPNEIGYTSKAMVVEKFPNLVHFTYMNDGGHFSAFQLPMQLAAELHKFLKKIKNTTN